VLDYEVGIHPTDRYKKKLKGKYEICGDKKRKTPWFVINGKG